MKPLLHANLSVKKYGGTVVDEDYLPIHNTQDIKALGALLSGDEMEDVMRTAFGNHVTVTATREGFKIDEYDHE